jgi:stress response protein YsnF
MRERGEVPVVNKEARVVEEISLNKEVTERDETIRDTVRDTEVDIDNLDNTNKRNNNLDSDRI